MNIRRKVFVAISVVSGILLIGLMVPDILLFIKKGSSNIVLRILELFCSIPLTVSLALTLSININIKKSDISTGSKNMFITTVNVDDGCNLNGLTISPNSISVDKDLTTIKGDLELLKKENIDRICELVLEKVNQSQNLKPVDRDFLIKYLNEGSSISDSDIQKIWAELLIAKVTEGTSVTKRLLDIVKNLSSEEAKIFDEVCSFSTNEGIIFDHFQGKIPFVKLSFLVDIGLINSSDFVSHNYNFTNNTNKIALARNNKLIIVGFKQDGMDATLSCNCRLLTKEGLLLKNILKKEMSDSDLLDLGKYLKDKARSQNIEVTAHLIENIENDLVHYNNISIL